MGRPDKIDIANIEISIKYSEHEIMVIRNDEQDPSIQGYFRATKCDIVIDDSLNEDMKREILFHEILHAVIHLYGVHIGAGDTALEKEEIIVNALSPALMMTLQANPAIREYLFT